MSETAKKYFSWVPRIIRKDFGRKMIALFFALLVYIVVTSKIGNEEKISDVPVNISVPASLILMDKTMPKVTVTVRSSERPSVADLKIEAAVEASKYITGEPYHLKITKYDVNAPSGVSVIKVEPGEIPIALDRIITKTVKLKPRFAPLSNLPEGYAVGKTVLTPSEVKLIGPGNFLNDIDSMQTNPIPLDKSTVESFDYEIQVDKISDAIKVTPPSVMAQVEILREYATRIFRSVPIKILNSMNGQNMNAELVSSPHVDVTLEGVKSKLESLKPEQLKAYIDTSAFEKPGVYNVDVQCWLNSHDIRIKNIYPAQVEIKLTKKAIK